MKHLFFFLMMVQILPQIASGQKQSCNAPDSAKDIIMIHSIYTARGYLEGYQLPEYDELLVPDTLLASVYRAFEVLYNHDSARGRDTVFPKGSEQQVLEEHPQFLFKIQFDKTHDYFTNYDSTNKQHTDFDSLLKSAGVNESIPYGRFVYKAVNVAPLIDTFLKFPWVLNCSDDYFVGDPGYDYGYKKAGDTTFISYTYAWGDCPAGCIYKKTFNYKIYDDCKLEFIGCDPFLLTSPKLLEKGFKLEEDFICDDSLLLMVDTNSFPCKDKISYNVIWEDGDTSIQNFVHQGGKYKVRIIPKSDKYQSYTSTIRVHDVRSLRKELNDTTICKDESIVIPNPLEKYWAYIWYRSWDYSKYELHVLPDTFSEPGHYTYDVRGCTPDTFNLRNYNLGIDLISKDQLCSGDSFVLNSNQSIDSVLWSDQSKEQFHKTTDTGWFYADFFIKNCTSQDSVYLKYFPEQNNFLGSDTSLYKGDSILYFIPGFNRYLWDNNDTGSRRIIGSELKLGDNIIWLEVQDTNGCLHTDSILLVLNESNSNNGIDNVQVQTFPNPNNGTLYTKCQLPVQKIIFYNGQGQIVFEERYHNVTNPSIDVQNIPNGTYTVELYTSSNAYPTVFKLIMNN